MKKMTIMDALGLLCKTTKCYGLYLAFPDDVFNPDELKKAVPFLDLGIGGTEVEGDYQAISSDYMFVLCESEKECYKLFDQVVGDEGPTKSNPYDGPMRVYAVTINSDGQVETTNT